MKLPNCVICALCVQDAESALVGILATGVHFPESWPRMVQRLCEEHKAAVANSREHAAAGHERRKQGIQKAFVDGWRFSDADGKQLSTIDEIMDAWVRDGRLHPRPPAD